MNNVGSSSKSSPMEIVNMMMTTPTKSSSVVVPSSSQADASSQEAIESLLLLGQEPILGPKKSEGGEFDSLDYPGGPLGSAEGISYYQRMRIRNNEASKRCRLKRRLKAEQLENQHNLLSMSNKLLKQRIQRLNKIVCLIKDCVKDMKEGDKAALADGDPPPCTCIQTVSAIRKYNRESPDSRLLSNEELLTKSRLNREIEDVTEVYVDLEGRRSSSSDDEKKPRLARSLSATPLLHPTRTSLDVINETIVKTLNTISSSVKSKAISVASPTAATLRPVLSNNVQVIPPQLVFVTRKSPPPKTREVLIKCEPDLRIVEEVVETTTTSNGGPGPCIVSLMDDDGPYKDIPCGNELHSINKLNGYLDLTSRTFSRDDGTSATERVIIKSALKLPFWQADEHPSFICDNHRQEISFQTDHTSCVQCGKKKKKPFPTPMSVITYRMSLEHHMNTGKILPIGQLLCCTCKDRFLKLDPSNKKAAPPKLPPSLPTEPHHQIMELASHHNTLVLNKQKDVKVIVQPVPRIQNFTSNNQIVSICPPNNSTPEVSSPTTSLVPTSSSSGNNDNIFNKISRLNDALMAVNPRYKPVGFSITSIESCSPSVLQDAIAATDTAVSTLLSVIAPGQESLLWESVKSKLDEKYGNKMTASISPINN